MLGPPVPRPSKILAIGLNYRGHAEESGLDAPRPAGRVHEAAERTLRARPTTSSFRADACGSTGRRSSCSPSAGEGGHAPAADAWSYVAGVTAGQDISDREEQFRALRQFTMAKSFDTYAPLGPVLSTTGRARRPGRSRRRLHGGRRDRSVEPHRRPDLPGSGADRLGLADLHARAGRPHLHRHAFGRGRRAQASALPGAGHGRHDRARRRRHHAKHLRRRAAIRGARPGRSSETAVSVDGLASPTVRTRSSRASTSRCAPASASACSGRTAPARPRPSRSSRATASETPGGLRAGHGSGEAEPGLARAYRHRPAGGRARSEPDRRRDGGAVRGLLRETPAASTRRSTSSGWPRSDGPGSPGSPGDRSAASTSRSG